MKKRITLLMILLGGVLAGRAQNPTILQTFQFTGYDYPSDPGGPGALVDITNDFTVMIGSTSAYGIDAYNNTGAMFGDNGSATLNNGVLNFNFPFTNNYTANVTLNTNSNYCTQCDGRVSSPVGTSNSVNNTASWYFGNDPLGQLITLDNTEFHTQYLIQIPQPVLNSTAGSGNNCATNVTLTAVINWPNLSGLTYSFEYQTGPSSFQVFAVTTNPVVSVGDYPALVSYLNSSSTTSVGFRVKATAANYTSPYGGNTVSFAPPPPSVGSYSVTDACGGGTQGIIQLNNITGLGNYLYVLLPSTATICNPTIPGSCTSGTSGSINGNSGQITGVLPGSYNLLVANNGGSAGACYQTIPVTINGFPALTASGTHTDVSCPGGNDGSITVTTAGGKPGTVTFQLVDLSTGATFPPQTTGTFTGLPAGNYQVNISNYCGAGPNPIFSLTQPTAVTGSYTQSNATCNNPGDGILKVTVGQGSGTYNYYLYLNGAIAASQAGSSFTNWEVDGLAPGVYDLQVQDASRASCAGYSATVTIGGPPALGLTVLQKTDVSCYGVSTGSMSLQGSGGMNIYTYTITNTTGGGSYSNSTGVFTGLAAGSYTAVLQSAVSGCGDQYSYPQPIVVSQPADIGIALSPTDVVCYGQGNGSITASLSGGTGSLALVWQQQAGGSWTDVGNGPLLNNLSPGSYRLSVTDANSCNKVSSVAAIAQPDVLVIPSVGLTDIVCYGGSGTMTPAATGGNGGNVFEYSGDGGSSYAAFVPGASFGAGSYQVRVTDSKGCRAGYATSQVITAPASQLVFSDQLSDYNGYNISCYGALTGVVTMSATGGNGASYSGYQYGVDGGGVQSSPVLSGLPAGVHTVRVIDGRGCIVQRTETLTQPMSAMAMSLLNKKDNDCADGLAGSLSVSASGGTAPYQFSKDGITYQNGGDFADLASGGYTITAMDVNGCRLGEDYTVVSLYPALSVNHTTGAVQCNGGSDGSIQLYVSGGFGGYTYQWSAAGNGNAATGLTAGTYTVHITDEKGCGVGDTAVVRQPAALAASLMVRPVCSDATGGRVKVAASGGTPPYRYANDGGSANPDSAFDDLSAGQHTIWVTDSHGCNWSKGVTITVNPLVPSVDFLVATQQNALDTLQAEDISSPKPDSVQWTFDPATLLLGSSAEGPLIRYAKPGTYPASMRAYYAGCDFSVTQNILIQPYDTNSTSPMVLAGLSIDTATLAPNPSSGTFNLYVKLYKAQRLVLTVTSLSGQFVFRKQWDGQQIVSEQVILPSSIVSGAYIAELVTETEVRDYNIIVAK
jgi:hypothetical protein